MNKKSYVKKTIHGLWRRGFDILLVGVVVWMGVG